MEKGAIAESGRNKALSVCLKIRPRRAAGFVFDLSENDFGSR